MATPDTLGGGTLLDWWKADAIAGVSDGASLNATSIPDSSGNNHTFTTDVIAGVYRAASGPNSMPFMDGSTTSGIAYSGPSTTAPTGDLTYFAVIRTTSPAIQSLIGSVGSGGAQLRLNNFKVELDRDGVGAVAMSNNTIPSGAWCIVIATYTTATGSFSINITGATETVAGSASQTFTSPGALNLGHYQSGATNPWLGGIAELGRYTSALSGADQTALYDYLQTKYAITPAPSSAQVESLYFEALSIGTREARVQSSYYEVLVTTPSTAVVSTSYYEILALNEPRLQYVGWGMPI